MINKEPPSILIVDDDEYNRVELTKLLQKKLPTVVIQEAENGDKALNMIKEHIERKGSSFDLIFMDFQMPGINGEITTQLIREQERVVKLNPASTIITWSSVKRAPYPEADDWMPKPAQQSDVDHILSLYGFVA